MKLHPVNPTPGIQDLPPAPPKEPVTTKELVVAMVELLRLIDLAHMGFSRGYDTEKGRLYAKLNDLRSRL